MGHAVRFKSKLDWITYINEGPKLLTELITLRTECYKAIELLRGRPLLVYCADFPPRNNEPISIDFTDIEGFTDLVESVIGNDSVDILIHSPGGSPDATERIVHILRNKFKEVHFLVPHSAYSAATMLALSGNSITLHPSATLGPIDPQINGIPARSMKKGFDNIRKIIHDEGPESLPAYMPLIEQYSIHLLEQCDDALLLSKNLARDWIRNFMLEGKEYSEDKLDSVVNYFSDYEKHLIHSRPIVYSKTLEFELPIFQADHQLSLLMWEAFLLLEGFFESTTFYKLFENSTNLSWGRQIPGTPIGSPKENE